MTEHQPLPDRGKASQRNSEKRRGKTDGGPLGEPPQYSSASNQAPPAQVRSLIPISKITTSGWGASSFTGYWFARALNEAGALVVAPLRGALADYREGARAERVRRLSSAAEIIETAPFGSDRFLALAKDGGYDILCHHAAQVGDYRSVDFDIAGALAQNTANLRVVLETLRNGGLKGTILTGSVFEQNEGAGEAPLVAFSPYGLSKGLTAEVFHHRCREAGVRYAKFVIPNPFGPLEEPRFCAYLIRAWKKGRLRG